MVLVCIMAALYAVACAVIQARTVPTFQAVTRSDNLCGLGNVPAFTLRHKVGAEKGRGAGVSGRLGLCTSCDSRMNALSGRASKTEVWMLALTAGVLDAIGVFRGVILGDTVGNSLKEALNIRPSRPLFRVWLASRYAKQASRYVWLASRINSTL
jgi:hypothetical protein